MTLPLSFLVCRDFCHGLTRPIERPVVDYYPMSCPTITTLFNTTCPISSFTQLSTPARTSHEVLLGQGYQARTSLVTDQSLPAVSAHIFLLPHKRLRAHYKIIHCCPCIFDVSEIDGKVTKLGTQMEFTPNT